MSKTERTWSVVIVFGLPLVTAALYLYSYAFEVGFARALGYPEGLIPIQVGLILNASNYLFFYVIALFMYLQLNLQYWPVNQRSTQWLILGALIILFVFFALKAFYPEHLILGLLLVSVSAFVGSTLRTRLQAQGHADSASPDTPLNVYDARSRIPQDSIAYAIVQRLGFDPLLLFVIPFIILPGMFWLAGFAEARGTKSFYTFTESNSSFVALRILGDNVIAARFDAKTGRHVMEFVVRPIEVLPPLSKVLLAE